MVIKVDDLQTFPEEIKDLFQKDLEKNPRKLDILECFKKLVNILCFIGKQIISHISAKAHSSLIQLVSEVCVLGGKVLVFKSCSSLSYRLSM